MKALVTIVTLAACLTLSCPYASSEEWNTYRGAWFEVQHPADFIVRPSIESTTATSGHDSAFFTSPDGDIELYVFSPLWNGEPTDILCDCAIETVVGSSRKEHNGEIEVLKTLAAMDKSYFRSYVDTENRTVNTRVVFGIKYRNTAVYTRFKAKYLKFKASLKQFSD